MRIAAGRSGRGGERVRRRRADARAAAATCVVVWRRVFVARVNVCRCVRCGLTPNALSRQLVVALLLGVYAAAAPAERDSL